MNNEGKRTLLTPPEAEALVRDIRELAAQKKLTSADRLRFSLLWSAVYRYFVHIHPDDPIVKLLMEVE